MKTLLPKLIQFYAVGLLLFMLPFTRRLFMDITPLTILLVTGLVFYYHQTWNLKTLLYFIFVGVTGFLVEVIGVATGKIFGDYQYDVSLGPKLFETPLIIGLNWLFLIYATHSIAGYYTKKPVIKVFSASVLMVVYDLILELAAPCMQMWHFNTYYPPLKNFIAWFALSFIFISGFELLKIKTNNKAANWIFYIQSGFFILITLYSLLFLQ